MTHPDDLEKPGAIFVSRRGTDWIVNRTLANKPGESGWTTESLGTFMTRRHADLFIEALGGAAVNASELETLRQIFAEVRYALRKGTALQMGLRASDRDVDERVNARALERDFWDLAKRLRLSCCMEDCQRDAVSVGGKCWYCSLPAAVAKK